MRSRIDPEPEGRHSIRRTPAGVRHWIKRMIDMGRPSDAQNAALRAHNLLSSEPHGSRTWATGMARLRRSQCCFRFRFDARTFILCSFLVEEQANGNLP